MEQITKKGLKLILIGIAIGFIVPLIAEIIGGILGENSNLSWIALSVSVVGILAAAVIELIGYKTAGKACPHFDFAFKWEIVAIVVILIYYGAQTGYELSKAEWLKWPSSIFNWFTIIVDLLVLWCVTRGCAEATDDEDKIVRLANAVFLLAILAEGIIIACDVIGKINADAKNWINLGSALMLLISSILQIILIAKSYKNVFIPEDAE